MTDLPPAPSRLSKSSLFSLIFGILGCIPLVTGALAMLLGLIGFFRAGKPGVRGRWMAVVGGMLGTISVVVWIIIFIVGFGAFMSAVYAAVGMIKAPGVATHDFIQALSTNDATAIKTLGPGFDDAAIDRLRTYVKAQGTFVDTTFTNTNIVNDTAHVEGTVKFSSGVQNVTADLEQVDGKWQVTKLSIAP